LLVSKYIFLDNFMIQIDSGPPGIVYGVTTANDIKCRIGFSPFSPHGTGWRDVPGTMKYVSCGPYGCWAVNSNNAIWFRHGVTPEKCEGSTWTNVVGQLKQIEVNC
jgi:hypothetical protein